MLNIMRIRNQLIIYETEWNPSSLFEFWENKSTSTSNNFSSYFLPIGWIISHSDLFNDTHYMSATVP